MNRIYAIREENELTQKELADILGVDRTIISKWEIGDCIPSIEKVNLISNYFNVSLDYIFNLTKTKFVNKIREELNSKIIGERLFLVRKSKNLTLYDLASELNTTQSTISAYENGKTIILTAFAIQICRKYKISMDWLYGKIN